MDFTVAMYRKAIGLTQKELAKKVGITRSALSLYEIGARDIPSALLPAFAAVFNCKIEDLYKKD